MRIEESTKKNLAGRTIPSPLGKLWLVANDDALLVAEFFGQKYERPFDLPEHTKRHAVLDLAEREFELYFAGKLKIVTTPLGGIGTPFQKKVWRGLVKIPFGETRSYLELAKSVAIDPAAVRAVGMANARNPIAIFVPCHRVIAASGALSGYAGGVDKKKWLLAHESKQRPLVV